MIPDVVGPSLSDLVTKVMGPQGDIQKELLKERILSVFRSSFNVPNENWIFITQASRWKINLDSSKLVRVQACGI